MSLKPVEPRPCRRVVVVSIIVGVTGALAALGLVVWQVRRPHRPPPGLVYSGAGMGGFVSRGGPPAPVAARGTDPLAAATAAYQRGRYREARALAQVLYAGARPTADPTARRTAARARILAAFASARTRNLADARRQFAAARRLAAGLPSDGIGTAAAAATLEEQAAYQHAVCTGALGDRAGAEAELIAFMRAFPESPLVQACIRRIGALHDGEAPPQAEAVWRTAMEVARRRLSARRRAESSCGPACLAELLRRQGRSVLASALASAMGTDETGTSVAALARVAGRYGFRPRGVVVSWAGLQRQRLPLIALVRPDHYVIVERIDSRFVHFWDSSGAGSRKGQRQSVPHAAWRQLHTGVAVVLR